MEGVLSTERRTEVRLTDLKYEFKSYVDLDDRIREEVKELYMEGWRPVLEEERKVGIIKLPIHEEVKEQFESELYTEHFPEGQMVLIAKIEGKWRPLVFVRSLIWRVEESKVWEGTEFERDWNPDDQIGLEELSRYFENYPETWYKASNYGRGYSKIQVIENGERRDYISYEDVRNSRREENLKQDLVLINYALTRNRRLGIKVKGAVGATVKERNRLKEKWGLLHCDTFTPLSGYAEWIRRKGEYPVEVYVKSNIKEERSVFDAAIMHLLNGAKLMWVLENARFDPRSKNYCVVTRYS